MSVTTHVSAADLSRRQLDPGRQFCCLYTDLADPTSNSIYQKIGYVPVADSSHYRFVPRGETLSLEGSDTHGLPG